MKDESPSKIEDKDASQDGSVSVGKQVKDLNVQPDSSHSADISSRKSPMNSIKNNDKTPRSGTQQSPTKNEIQQSVDHKEQDGQKTTQDLN